MQLVAWPEGGPGVPGKLLIKGRVATCALGRSGLSDTKQEGDGASPVGIHPVRRVHYRADRWASFEAAIPLRVIERDDGWCDASNHPAYNRLIKRPFDASHEELWREDHLYDVVVELGWNDQPPVPGLGSAIFLHLARPKFTPTEGCIAVAPETMQRILEGLTPTSTLEIRRTQPVG